MIVLKIIGIVLAVLLLLIAVLLLLPVDLLLISDEEKGFHLHVRFLGMVFSGKSEEKKKEKDPKQESFLAKALKKTLGISHLESLKTIGSSVEEQGVTVTLQETVQTFFLLFDRVLWILKHCSVPHCRIVSVSGGENAALDYGIACATLYPLTDYLQEKMKVNRRGLSVDIRCDYAQEKGKFLLDLAIRIKILYVVRAFLHIIKKNIGNEIERA